MTVKRSLDSENACVLRVRCAAGDDIGISSITLIYAEIVTTNAQTRQDAVRLHFYAGEFEHAVPVSLCAHGRSASAHADLRPAAACAAQWLCTQRMLRVEAGRRDVTAAANLPALAIGATRSEGRFYNRRHLPLALRLPG
ncbi:hypothetical protein QZM81_33620 [Burkholderia cepacia]|uniref:hypothetical protein n=1 Tax=Burkholderia cepacia TaxID=292 RepID=UPI0026541261|nr:hypothetical protein [Burkholderia cepacia]MDN7860756.1 hypothetical protein [Burkholderia cepacia]